MSHQLTFADSEFSSKRRQTGLVDQIGVVSENGKNRTLRPGERT